MDGYGHASLAGVTRGVVAYRHSEDDAVLALQRDGLEGSGVSRSGAEGERVLGIDPGTRVLGYGVVEGNGRGEPRLVAVGSFRVERAGEGYASLLAIRRCVCALVEWYAPGVVAIEAPFLGKNAQSMLKLGRAQGVAIAALVELGLDVQEYAPRKVKMSLTGCGDASKEQVKGMLSSMYPAEGIMELKDFDSTDALAVAMCHYHSGRAVGRTGKGSWGEFVAKHPDRVRG